MRDAPSAATPCQLAGGSGESRSGPFTLARLDVELDLVGREEVARDADPADVEHEAQRGALRDREDLGDGDGQRGGFPVDREADRSVGSANVIERRLPVGECSVQDVDVAQAAIGPEVLGDSLPWRILFVRHRPVCCGLMATVQACGA